MDHSQDELNRRRQQRLRDRQRRARKKRIKKILLITLAVLAAIAVIVGIISIISKTLLNKPDSTTPTTPPETTLPGTTGPAMEDKVIHLVAGGDLNITDKTVASGLAVSGYDYTDVFMDLVPTLSGADLSILNFEGGVFGSPYGSDSKSAPTQMLTALQNAGVDMLQAANSQSLAGGLNGLTATLDAIRKAGMEPLGAYRSQEEAEESGGFVIWEIQGIRVAVVAFTKGMEDSASLHTGSEKRINLLYTDYDSAFQKVDTAGITRILKDIEACQPDVTIAMLHWGSEFNNQISTTQKKITDLMLSNGVDAIIGSHSHYVQKAEYDEKNGMVVAYSLGDFFGDAKENGTDYSVLLDLEITKDGATGKTKITKLDYTPVFICDETDSGGSMRLLRIREAMEAYENNAIGCVSKEVYTKMASVLAKIESRMPEKK